MIEDNVEIGANSTIDRGALGETRIGAGTKIDNLVHIGHNCVGGQECGHRCAGGDFGLLHDWRWGDSRGGRWGFRIIALSVPGVILGGQAGVFRGATVEGPGQMFAGTPAEPIKDYLKSMARLRRLK